jgi:predicted RNase H-like HicB family nuclease
MSQPDAIERVGSLALASLERPPSAGVHAFSPAVRLSGGLRTRSRGSVRVQPPPLKLRRPRPEEPAFARLRRGPCSQKATPQVKGCHSYGRTIDQARDRIREALALFVDNAETAEIEDDVRMPASVRGAVRNAQRMRQRLETARTQFSAAEERAVRQLRRTMKLGHRDAGSILGLSHQRVHQLEKKKAG